LIIIETDNKDKFDNSSVSSPSKSASKSASKSSSSSEEGKSAKSPSIPVEMKKSTSDVTKNPGGILKAAKTESPDKGNLLKGNSSKRIDSVKEEISDNFNSSVNDSKKRL
jgi:hypothetical protein